VDFAELNSYDIGGLSSAILRCVPSDSIRYIFGATGEGRRKLREDPTHALHYSNYIFIQRNEDIRTCISKNTSLRPVRPVRQTHLTHRMSIAIQHGPGAHPTLRTQPDAAPNPRDATRRSTQSSGRNQTQHPILRTRPHPVPTLPEISEISEGSPLYLFLTLVTRVTIYFT